MFTEKPFSKIEEDGQLRALIEYYGDSHSIKIDKGGVIDEISAPVIFSLANNNSQGESVTREVSETACNYYKWAIKKKSSYSAYALGCMYADGRCFQRDMDKAREYYELAANRGYMHAKNMINSLWGDIKDLEGLFYSGTIDLVICSKQTCVSVALSYFKEAKVSKKTAPRVVAYGVEDSFDLMLRLAKENCVFVYEDKLLEEYIFNTVMIGEEILKEMYYPVAKIYADAVNSNKK